MPLSSTSHPPVTLLATPRHPPSSGGARSQRGGGRTRFIARIASLSAGRDTYPQGRHRRFLLPAASIPRRATLSTAAALLPEPGACRRQEGGAARPQQAAEKRQRQHPHRPAGASDGWRHAAPGRGARSLPGPPPPPLPWPPCHSGVGPARRTPTPRSLRAGLVSRGRGG